MLLPGVVGPQPLRRRRDAGLEVDHHRRRTFAGTSVGAGGCPPSAAVGSDGRAPADQRSRPLVDLDPRAAVACSRAGSRSVCIQWHNFVGCVSFVVQRAGVAPTGCACGLAVRRLTCF